MENNEIQRLQAAIGAEIAKVIVGQQEAQRLLLIGLLTGGHVLLEGPPGTGKTLLCRAVARAISLEFKRIQFTPDLMPGDVLGSNIFNFQKSAFELVLGPVFTELLLADEINRTPPKTQSALLEAMNERSVTIDGSTRSLSPGFMVVATQNPLEQQGTYPLPEAQLDRFLFMHVLDFPVREQEIDIVLKAGPAPHLEQIVPVTNLARLLAVREGIARVRIAPEVASYVVDFVAATRRHPALSYGASTRAAVMLAQAARAVAALEGRDFVIPDDVKEMAKPCLRHRVIVSPASQIDGLTADQALDEITQKVEAPR